ncbi:MAG: hypothetical protein BroJett031_33040 [Betaproteobacteria bacterium]|nr:MAG: hypothetical protein BroJett031_33040 [Betaproteobacteria bacterium]
MQPSFAPVGMEDHPVYLRIGRAALDGPVAPEPARDAVVSVRDGCRAIPPEAGGQSRRIQLRITPKDPCASKGGRRVDARRAASGPFVRQKASFSPAATGNVDR